MATTRVNFSGMIGFVPKEPNEENPGKAMRVLFKDGGEPHLGPEVDSKGQFTDREHLFPHLAVVHFRLGDLDPASLRRPDLTGNGRGVCFLKYEELSLGEAVETDSLEYEMTRLSPQEQDEGEEGLVNATTPKPGHPQPPLGVSASLTTMPGTRDLCWLLPPDVACGKGKNTAKVRAGCLARNYDVDPNKLETGDNLLVARTRLDNGLLYTRQFRTKGVAGQRRMALCDFFQMDSTDPSKPTGNVLHSQCLATLVAWEPKEGDKALRISSKSFNFAGKAVASRPDLVFRKPEGRDVEIHLWNATVPDILSVIAAPGDKPGFRIPTGDRSFRAFYRLLATPAHFPAPLMERHELIAATMTISDTESGKGVGCPLAGFADDPAA